MRSHRALLLLAALVLVPAPTRAAPERLRVVTSTSDLAAIAREIGGERIEVESIARGTQDPHFVELLPSHMVRVRKAALYVKVGMDLDYWAQAIIDGSRNARLEIVDCSAKLPPERRLEVPGRVDASMGDVHRYGNPHYWLDPANGRFIAETIAEGLAKVDPDGRGTYEARLAAFGAELERKLVEWRDEAAPIRGMRIVTYHNSWPYFAQAFGIEVVGWLEPKPGVKPSPGHVSQLIERMGTQGVKVVAREPYFEGRTPELVSRRSGVPSVVLLPSVGGLPEVTDYFGLFDHNLSVLQRYAGS